MRLVAVTTRPQQPLTIERALRRLAGDPELHESDTAIRPIELSFLRQMPASACAVCDDGAAACASAL